MHGARKRRERTYKLFQCTSGAARGSTECMVRASGENELTSCFSVRRVQREGPQNAWCAQAERTNLQAVSVYVGCSARVHRMHGARKRRERTYKLFQCTSGAARGSTECMVRPC